MSKLAATIFLVVAVLAAGLAGAAEYRAFTAAGTGDPLVFAYVSMTDNTTGFAHQWAADAASVTIFKTQDGGLTWSAVAQLDTPLSPTPNGWSCITLSHIFLVRVSYWNQATFSMAGRLWASWDQGASWTELTDQLKSAVGSSTIGIWNNGVSENGIWVRATASYASGLKSYMLHSQDQGASWNQYAPVAASMVFSVSKSGYLAGYGTSSNTGGNLFYFYNLEQNQFNYVNSAALANLDPDSIHNSFNSGVFTLLDRLTGNSTPNRVASYSLDGGVTWSVLFDSAVNAGDHPDQDFFSARALDGQNAYGAWHRWTFEADGTAINHAYAIKKTSDSGATWTTLDQGDTDNYWYEVMVSQEGQPWVGRTQASMGQYVGGIFNLDN